MADTKISAESAVSSLDGTEAIPVVQGGANKKANPLDILKVVTDSTTLKKNTGTPGQVALDVISLPTYENISTLPSPGTAVDYTAIVRAPAAQTDTNVTSYPVVVRSNGTLWRLASNPSIIAYMQAEVKCVFANSVTWTVADNGSGLVRLTASGAHGLTTGATHAGRHFIVKTTQNGWTQYERHAISTVVDATNIDLTTPIGSLGVPVFYLKTEQAPVCWFVIPPLKPRSQIIITPQIEHSATANSKRLIVTLGSAVAAGDEHCNINQTTGTVLGNYRPTIIKNRNSTSIQRASAFKTLSVTAGTISTALVDGTQDTSVATIATVYSTIATVDEYMDFNSIDCAIVL